MKWLKSILTLIAIVSATGIAGSAFAYHRHWHQPYYGSPADVLLQFSIGDPWYAPATRYYYEPSPSYYYGRRYHYYGRDAGYYYYYGEPVFDYSAYNRQFPQSGD
jgi:hypothetical protein